MAMTGMMRIDDRKGNSMIFIGITGGVGAGKFTLIGDFKGLATPVEQLVHKGLGCILYGGVHTKALITAH